MFDYFVFLRNWHMNVNIYNTNFKCVFKNCSIFFVLRYFSKFYRHNINNYEMIWKYMSILPCLEVIYMCSTTLFKITISVSYNEYMRYAIRNVCALSGNGVEEIERLCWRVGAEGFPMNGRRQNVDSAQFHRVEIRTRQRIWSASHAWLIPESAPLRVRACGGAH